MAQEKLTHYYAENPTREITAAIRNAKRSDASVQRSIQKRGRIQFVYISLPVARGNQVASFPDSEAIHLGTSHTWADVHRTLITKDLPASLAQKKVSFEIAQLIAQVFARIHGQTSGIPASEEKYDAYIARVTEGAQSEAGQDVLHVAPRHPGTRTGSPARAAYAPIVG